MYNHIVAVDNHITTIQVMHNPILAVDNIHVFLCYHSIQFTRKIIDKTLKICIFVV